jgi:hypothetical protein
MKLRAGVASAPHEQAASAIAAISADPRVGRSRVPEIFDLLFMLIFLVCGGERYVGRFLTPSRKKLAR